MMPLVSVIIPVFNNIDFLPSTLDSVINQTYKNLEIIIVNDGSTDGSGVIIDDYRIKHPELIKVIHQKQSGAGHARNMGLARASGSYIQFLDGDDVLDEHKIHSQISLIENSCSDYLCFGKWTYFDEIVGDTALEDFSFYKDYNEPVQLLFDLWENQQMIALFSWLIPKELIEKAGFWNEALSLNDDGEFMARVIRASRKMIFSEKALGYYRKPKSHNLSSGKDLNAAKSMFEVFSNYERFTEDLSHNHLRNLGLIKNYEHFIYRMNAVDLVLIEQAFLKIIKLSGKRYPYKFKESKLLFFSQYFGIRFPLYIKRTLKIF